MGARAVFLIGFMGSGKTAVGRELARRLDWSFIDLDARIESQQRCTIAAFFSKHGEGAFRKAETASLDHLLRELDKDTVVALGGGAFAQAGNRELLRGWPSVFLEASPEELWKRCATDATVRPLRTNREQFFQLYQDRLPFYREATVTVQTSSRDLGDVCFDIEGVLNLRSGQVAGGLPEPLKSETGDSH